MAKKKKRPAPAPAPNGRDLRAERGPAPEGPEHPPKAPDGVSGKWT